VTVAVPAKDLSREKTYRIIMNGVYVKVRACGAERGGGCAAAGVAFC